MSIVKSDEAKNEVIVSENYKDVDVLNEDIGIEDRINIATRIAKPLKDIIESQGLSKAYGGGQNKHVFLEGWNILGTMLGLHAYTEDTYEVELKNTKRGASKIIAYESIVSIRDNNTNSIIFGRSTNMCTNEEKGRTEHARYAIRSMAESRTTGKAWRNALAWVMKMAGYATTPAEEMENLLNDDKNKKAKERMKKKHSKPDDVVEGDFSEKEKTTNNSTITTKESNKTDDKESDSYIGRNGLLVEKVTDESENNPVTEAVADYDKRQENGFKTADTVPPTDKDNDPSAESYIKQIIYSLKEKNETVNESTIKAYMADCVKDKESDITMKEANQVIKQLRKVDLKALI